MKESFKSISFVFRFIKRHLLLTIFLVVSILCCALSGLLPSYILKYLIDDYIMKYISLGDIETSSLTLMSFVYFSSYLLITLFTILEEYVLNQFGQKLIHELRYEMIVKTHHLKANYFTHHGTGQTQSLIVDDVYAIETLFASGIVSILVSLVKIIGILVSIFVFSVILGLMILILVPIIFFITRKVSKKMLKVNIINRKVINTQSNHISETMDNLRTIQNLNKENYLQNEFNQLLVQSYKSQNSVSVYDAIFSPILEMLKAILIAILSILVFYGNESTDSIFDIGISVGTFAASLNLISNIFSPIQEISKEIQTMQEGISGMKRVEEFMNIKEDRSKDEFLSSNKIFENEKEDIIEVKDVSFRYEDGDEDVFSNLSFAIKKGAKVTFKGRTGAGKTTFFKLLLGLEYATKGEILINGYNVSLIPNKEKRNIFGYVEQGFHSIDGTILQQITLKDESYDINQVKEVMKKIKLDEYITSRFEKGYETPFKETEFSRGQLQLLSLARALLSNPKILLLDEISANLDSKTEADIISAIASLKDKTVLSISHRLSDQLAFDSIIEIK